MGYEVHFVDVPHEVAEARRAFYRHPESDEVDRYFDLEEPYSKSYNAAGWGFLRKTMETLGMVSHGEPTGVPDDPHDDLPEEDLPPDGIDWSWRRQRLAAPGIALFKLRSNDDWVVTPEEISEALAAYADAPDKKRRRAESDELWIEWLGWLREAQERGGFIVT